MSGNERTSKVVAQIASKGLKNPGGLTHAEIRKLAASALTQAPDKSAKKPAAKKAAKKPAKKIVKRPAKKAAKKK